MHLDGMWCASDKKRYDTKEKWCFIPTFLLLWRTRKRGRREQDALQGPISRIGERTQFPFFKMMLNAWRQPVSLFCFRVGGSRGERRGWWSWSPCRKSVIVSRLMPKRKESVVSSAWLMRGSSNLKREESHTFSSVHPVYTWHRNP